MYYIYYVVWYLCVKDDLAQLYNRVVGTVSLLSLVSRCKIINLSHPPKPIVIYYGM